ncbi:MAG TPA: sigma-70 family RNA polymerase sigma factor [Gemmatimonadota bacterium]|nr:sigma-70 family RNA polymerase sigma factor [Gemmatimonadota bacterium]
MTEERSFDELLEVHLDALWAMALRLARGDAAEAEDLMQDAAVKACRSFHDLEDESAGRSWLLTILSRTHLNRARSRRRRPERTESALEPGALEAALAAWNPVRTPEDEFASRELHRRLVEALDALPAGQRVVVWLVDVEGFRHREAARMLDVAEGTVASRLYRGRRELRRLLIGEAGGRRAGGGEL